jgi:aldehyde oxidoreductase
MPAARVEGATVETVEGARRGTGFRASATAFLRHGAAQCGICTPGMLMAATALLRAATAPTPRRCRRRWAACSAAAPATRKIIDAVVRRGQDRPARPTPRRGGVGARVERLDGSAKVDGTEAFGADRWSRGPLVVRLSARRTPRGLRLRRPRGWRHGAAGGGGGADGGGHSRANRFGVIPAFADQPVLAETAARFRGEAVALVVGERRRSRRSTSRDFPWSGRPCPPARRPQAALDPGAPLLHAGRPGNLLVEGVVRRGDADAALAPRRHVVAGRFETAHVEHAYIEPEAGFAAALDGERSIEACTQAPVMDRDETAAILGLPPSGCG